MTALTIALWVIAFEVAIAVIVLMLAFFKFSKHTSDTLEETQNLVKSLEKRIDTVGIELESTVKNTDEATVHLKKTFHNTEKATSFINAALPIASLILLFRGITIPISGINVNTKKEKQNSIISTIMNAGKWLVVLQQGFSFYKKYIGRGGKSNGRK